MLTFGAQPKWNTFHSFFKTEKDVETNWSVCPSGTNVKRRSFCRSNTTVSHFVFAKRTVPETKRRKGIPRLIKQIQTNEYGHRLSAIIAQPLPIPRSTNQFKWNIEVTLVLLFTNHNCPESERAKWSYSQENIPLLFVLH